MSRLLYCYIVNDLSHDKDIHRQCHELYAQRIACEFRECDGLCTPSTRGAPTVKTTCDAADNDGTLLKPLRWRSARQMFVNADLLCYNMKCYIQIHMQAVSHYCGTDQSCLSFFYPHCGDSGAHVFLSVLNLPRIT